MVEERAQDREINMKCRGRWRKQRETDRDKVRVEGEYNGIIIIVEDGFKKNAYKTKTNETIGKNCQLVRRRV